MARAHGVALLIIILGGTAAWICLAQPSPDPVPTPPAPRPRAADGSVDLQRGNERSGGAVDQPEPPPRPTEAPADAGKVTDAPSPNVVGTVRVLHGNEPVAAFQWQWRGATTVRGTGQDGMLALALPHDSAGTLTIEAAGHQPHQLDLRTPRAGAGPTALDVFLAPAARGAGVELLLRDPQGAAVPRIAVELWAVQEGASIQDDPTDRPLWSRRTAAPAGGFVLPDLQPGSYWLRARAVDEQGGLLPLLPFRSAFTFGGSEHVPLHAGLGAGTLLSLELVDATGAALATQDAQGNPRVIGLLLVRPDGNRQNVDWRVVGPSGALVRRDGLPATGVAEATEALSPGSWRLDIQIDGQLRLQSPLVLRAGESQRERIVVP